MGTSAGTTHSRNGQHPAQPPLCGGRQESRNPLLLRSARNSGWLPYRDAKAQLNACQTTRTHQHVDVALQHTDVVLLGSTCLPGLWAVPSRADNHLLCLPFFAFLVAGLPVGLVATSSARSSTSFSRAT